jgi:hypothetical protein
MISLIIAGGVYMAANAKTVEWTDIDNHTLKGEAIASSKVVCRDRWGTPMLPNGKGGYSLIAAINEDYIQESLIQPPEYPRGMVAYRPLPTVEVTVETPVSVPAPPTVTPPVEAAPAPESATPVEAPLPDAGAAPAAPTTPADAPFAPAPQ